MKKKLSEILPSNTEIVGLLSSIKNEKNKIKLVFTILKEIEIPQNTIPQEKIESLIGYRIGIFHADNNSYKIRKI